MPSTFGKGNVPVAGDTFQKIGRWAGLPASLHPGTDRRLTPPLRLCLSIRPSAATSYKTCFDRPPGLPDLGGSESSRFIRPIAPLRLLTLDAPFPDPNNLLRGKRPEHVRESSVASLNPVPAVVADPLVMKLKWHPFLEHQPATPITGRIIDKPSSTFKLFSVCHPSPFPPPASRPAPPVSHDPRPVRAPLSHEQPSQIRTAKIEQPIPRNGLTSLNHQIIKIIRNPLCYPHTLYLSLSFSSILFNTSTTFSYSIFDDLVDLMIIL